MSNIGREDRDGVGVVALKQTGIIKRGPSYASKSVNRAFKLAGEASETQTAWIRPLRESLDAVSEAQPGADRDTASARAREVAQRVVEVLEDPSIDFMLRKADSDKFARSIKYVRALVARYVDSGNAQSLESAVRAASRAEDR